MPALTTNQGYCECVDGTATFYNCENFGDFDATNQTCLEPACDPNMCIGIAEDKAFPAKGTTTGFCLCAGGKVTYEECPDGSEFDPIGLCKVPHKNCEDSMCEGQSDNTKLPALFTQNGYCSCLDGLASFEECPNNWIFDMDTSSCKGADLPVKVRHLI